MRKALIGNTGFVGSNLLRQTSFDALYNSSNIEEMGGETFDLLVCAGAPGARLLANREPERDLESLEKLLDALGRVTATHVALVSTTDVYPVPCHVDEDSPIQASSATTFGRHRYALEEFVRIGFASTVLRLPSPFGPGLKENVLYDLLHSHRLEHVQPASTLQFYDLTRLWQDVERGIASEAGTLNLVPEPTSVADVGRSAFGIELEVGTAADDPVQMDVHTRHAETLGGTPPYACGTEEVLAGIRAFVEREGWRRP